ncbi:hypothetical protein H2198_003303 [Neophaeococcomyces mojaviensis]|uniref:Uncharacterized protein n=1 Tax=Neophaeococcomyces mojaviensis TaxID=3383035 RepID=A0ACC3ABS0_9EURO|nr:hypothetical protein H2198_003303 [Knufia sp. JES_112]
MFSSLNPIPSLPEYTGPYKVATTEFEIPISEIQSSSTVPDSQISTVKFRLFYPTSPDSTSKQSVYWLPNPQNKWVEAYASFMGAGSTFSTLLSHLPSLLNYITIPAIKDAPLLPPETSPWPVCIFSHGLGGNYNTYSSIVGSLASCGVVCIAPEHRDGSAPVSFIRNAEGKIVATIPYQKHSHSPSTEVLNARNDQLRIRLWELELIYMVIQSMNDGKQFTNYAEDVQSYINLKNQVNLQPGKVTWAGHSFGAATQTQFVKSIFYHQHLPTNNEDAAGWNWTPLYQTTSNSDLVKQITAQSPVALLDLWTMPLRSETTKWLWERPMPCYARDHWLNTDNKNSTPNTIAIMSAEFHNWTEMLNRTRALLSKSPVEAIALFKNKQSGKEGSRAASIQERKAQEASKLPSKLIPELSKQEPTSQCSSAGSSPDSSRDPSPARSTESLDPSDVSPASSQSSLPLPEYQHETSASTETSSTSAIEPHLYLIPQSAHLSQSDFGPLFPSLVKYVMKAIEPEKTLELNVRAIAAVMKGRDLPVKTLVKAEEDHILNGDDLAKEPRWVRLPLVDA